MRKDCCLNCKERHYLCHSTCEKHKARKEQDAMENKQKSIVSMINDYNGTAALRLEKLTRHSSARNKGMVHKDSSITQHMSCLLDIEYEYD